MAGFIFKLMYDNAETVKRLLILVFVSMAGLKLGRFINAVQRVQQMTAVMASVPTPRPPQGIFAGLIHRLLGPAIPLLIHTPWEVMRQWVADSPPIVRIRILMRPCVIVGSAEGLKRIFQTKQRLYDKDLGFSYKPFLPILGTGLVTANGKQWQEQRVLIGPALRVDILDDVIRIATAAVDRLTDKLSGAADRREIVDMEEEFRLLTLQVIGEAILGLPHEECDEVFPQLYLPVMEEANRRVLSPWRTWLPTPASVRFNRRMDRLNSFIISLLRRRWRRQAAGKGKAAAHPDVLSRILSSIKERGETWDEALETQLCYEIKTFLLAGHETSAAMLTWTLYELTQNEAAVTKVRSEAKSSLSKGKSPVASRASVEEMDFTLATLKESLRKYSVVPVVVRELSEADQLEGHSLPAGTTVICHLQAVHHSWKDPETWRPERFLTGGEYEAFPEDIRQYKFVPFIQGPRNCLGQFFALLEARVVLGLLIKRFDFRSAIEGSVKTHPSVIPVGPSDGMPMTVSRATV